jgi:ABC-2 type transport system ATP-binding protein
METQMDDSKFVEVSHLSKSFGQAEVVKDISFDVVAGEIFGMVGPNGAGKTTTIRMLMDIIKPDFGEIKILGKPLKESTKNRIGYLPEERGLYRKLTASDTITYLAALKNIEIGIAKTRMEKLLNQMNMFQHKNKKIEQLSRGMGQLIQFAVTIIHNPDLIILDEPLSGLDPVNQKLIKEQILELKNRGKSIILSTHLMNEVEELCDRILMINKGKAVLYGELSEIKSRFRNNSIFLECNGALDDIKGVVRSRNYGKYQELFLDGQASPQEILKQLLERGIEVSRFEISTPSLNEIFIQIVQEKSDA